MKQWACVKNDLKGSPNHRPACNPIYTVASHTLITPLKILQFIVFSSCLTLSLSTLPFFLNLLHSSLQHLLDVFKRLVFSLV